MTSKTLIIYAHPNNGGHCEAIKNEVIESLGKENITLIDLYKDKYDPVMKENEHYVRPNMWDISKENKKYQELIKKHKKLIFIYPTWWNGPPAILKGWIDRVLTGQFAFKYVKGLPVGLLKGRKAAVFVTTGANKIIAKLILGERSIKTVARDTLGFCGIRTKGFLLGKCIGDVKDRKEDIEKLVKKGLKYLN